MVPVKLQILFNELFVVKDSKMKIISSNQVNASSVAMLYDCTLKGTPDDENHRFFHFPRI